MSFSEMLAHLTTPRHSQCQSKERHFAVRTEEAWSRCRSSAAAVWERSSCGGVPASYCETLLDRAGRPATKSGKDVHAYATMQMT